MDAQTSPLVLSQLPKYIQKSTTAQLKHGPFLLQHCQCHFTQYLQENNTHKLIEQRIILNRSERFYLLNISTRFNRRLGVRLWRFRCRLAVYKKRTKYWQLCPNCRSWKFLRAAGPNNEGQTPNLSKGVWGMPPPRKF